MDKEKKAEWEGWIKRAISDYNSAKKLVLFSLQYNCLAEPGHLGLVDK